MKTRVRVIIAVVVAISATILTGLKYRVEKVDSCVPTREEVEAILHLNPSFTRQMAEDVARYSCEFAIRPEGEDPL